MRSDLTWQDAEKTIPSTNESPIWVAEDKSNNGNHLIQATEAKRPVYLTNQANGHPALRFDGTDDYLKAAPFTLTQPSEIFLVLNLISDDAGGRILDGNAGNSMTLYMTTNAIKVEQYVTQAGAQINISPGSWKLLQALYTNVAGASLLRVNGGSPSYGTPGLGTPGGFTLAAFGAGVACGNIDVAELVVYSPPIGDTDRILLQNYFNAEAQQTGYALW